MKKEKMKKLVRLNTLCVYDLVEFSEQIGKPLTEEQASVFCTQQTNTLTYGLYEESKLISIVIASLFLSYPVEGKPSGRVFYISSAGTLPDYRNNGYASTILKVIEDDAKVLRADYILMSSELEALARKNEYQIEQSFGSFKKL